MPSVARHAEQHECAIASRLVNYVVDITDDQFVFIKNDKKLTLHMYTESEICKNEIIYSNPMFVISLIPALFI